MVATDLVGIADELRSIAYQIDDIAIDDDEREDDSSYALRLRCCLISTDPKRSSGELIVEILREVGLDETAAEFERSML